MLQNQYAFIQQEVSTIEKIINQFKKDYFKRIRLANYCMELGSSIASTIDYLSHEIIRILEMHRSKYQYSAEGLNCLIHLSEDEGIILTQAYEQMDLIKAMLSTAIEK